MPKAKNPRHGSMQVWPRKRASRPYARVRSFLKDGEGMLAFAGYKMGMTHVMAFDTDKNSISKNETIVIPATILECPPLRVFSVRAYTHDHYGHKVAKEVVVLKDKHLGRKIFAPKNPAAADKIDLDPSQYDKFTIIVSTQPHLTGIGQKKPQLFEMEVGGSAPAEQLEFIKSIIGKEIKASEVFKEGDQLDAHAVTTGRGVQGVVKRFGVSLKRHKSEKGVRRVGSLGGWSGQAHFMYRVAFAGQTGYHQRVQYNNQILKITDKPEEIAPKGGFINYGVGRKGNEFLVVRGSVPGPKKRMITLLKAIRQKQKLAMPTVDTISLESKQGK